MNDYVTVESFQLLPLAESARLVLESEGIDVYLADKETVSTDWALGNAIGYIKLQVPPAQVEAANAALQRMRSERAARESDVDASDKCLACGAPFQRSQTTCAECGWSFADDTTDDVRGAGEDDNETAADAFESSPAIDNSNEEEGAKLSNAMLRLKPLMVSLILIPVAVGTAIVLLSLFGGLFRTF